MFLLFARTHSIPALSQSELHSMDFCESRSSRQITFPYNWRNLFEIATTATIVVHVSFCCSWSESLSTLHISMQLNHSRGCSFSFWCQGSKCHDLIQIRNLSIRPCLPSFNSFNHPLTLPALSCPILCSDKFALARGKIHCRDGIEHFARVKLSFVTRRGC